MPPHRSADKDFNKSYDMLVSWCVSHPDALPLHGSQDHSEHYLAMFLNRLRAMHKNNRLQPKETKMLRDVTELRMLFCGDCCPCNADSSVQKYSLHASHPEELASQVSGNSRSCEPWQDGKLTTHCLPAATAHHPELLKSHTGGTSQSCEPWRDASSEPYSSVQALFAAHYDDLVSWVCRTGELPCTSSNDRTEAALGLFLLKIHDKHSNGRLQPSHIELLLSVSGMKERLLKWDHEPQQEATVEQLFALHYNNLVSRVASNGKLPWIGSSLLAGFLHRICSEYKAGLLSTVHIELLLQVPGMKERFLEWDSDSQAMLKFMLPRIDCEPEFSSGRLANPRPTAATADHPEFIASQASCNSQSSEPCRDASSEPDPSVQAWFTAHYDDLVSWVTSSGKLPRGNGSNDRTEAVLGSFLCNIATKYKKGRLQSSEVDLLRQVPSMKERLLKWERDRDVTKDKMFMTHYDGLVKWVASTGKLPREFSQGRTEAVLVGFLQTIRIKYGAGLLQPSQIELLLQIPGMKERVLEWDGNSNARAEAGGPLLAARPRDGDSKRAHTHGSVIAEVPTLKRRLVGSA